MNKKEILEALKNETYVIAVMQESFDKTGVDDIAGFYNPSKYEDMWNLTILDNCKKFDTYEIAKTEAVKLCHRFKYKFEVFKYCDCLKRKVNGI